MNYIPGLPSKPRIEKIGDDCLCFTRLLWGGRTVEILENDQIHYNEQECIYHLFSESMGFLKAHDLDFCCAFPTAILLGAGTLLTSAVALPFELIGSCFKNCALASNPTSKAYNDLAASHLKSLRREDISPERIERLQTKLESDKSRLSFLEKIQELLPKGTRRLPKTVEFEDLHLLINPIWFEERIIDYEISGPFPGLPITKSALARDILLQKKAVETLEKLIEDKSQQLQSASEKFINDVKALNEESIPLLTRTIDEYQ